MPPITLESLLAFKYSISHIPLTSIIHSFVSLRTMGKSDAEVIALFNEQVNMTADELEAWLDDPQNREAGTGVGIESGRRIVEILRKNPEMKPDRYHEVRLYPQFFSPPRLSERVASTEHSNRKTWRISAKWSGEFFNFNLPPLPAAVVLEFVNPPSVVPATAIIAGIWPRKIT